MNKAIHFISGMPQAGASLLSSILSQNPRFECSVPGGLCDAIYMLNIAWQDIVQFKASPNEPGKFAAMRGMLQGYFVKSDRPVAFEKSRTWLGHLELVEHILGRKAKVLVPVRDMREILASFELLWRHNSPRYQNALEKKYYFDFQNIDGRCSRWLGPDSPIGLSYARLEDALQRTMRDRLHFVHYEELTHQPTQTLNNIYDFLDEPRFNHDLNNLKQIGPVDDPFYDFPISHNIFSKLKPFKDRAMAVLGPSAEKYKGPYAWDLSK